MKKIIKSFLKYVTLTLIISVLAAFPLSLGVYAISSYASINTSFLICFILTLVICFYLFISVNPFTEWYSPSNDDNKSNECHKTEKEIDL